MTASPNPVAPDHLPFFITAPGDTDVLFNVTMVFVLLSVVFFGIVFLTIHSLPERMAHKSKKVQLDIVAVLCLLALFSHEHVFWVAALLLAFIDIPDFSTPFQRMVTAVETIAEQQAGSTPPADESDSALPKAVPAEQPRHIQKGSIHA
jgi:multisubunit Na+/H+ antiporter MnhF subunit